MSQDSEQMIFILVYVENFDEVMNNYNYNIIDPNVPYGPLFPLGPGGPELQGPGGPLSPSGP